MAATLSIAPRYDVFTDPIRLEKRILPIFGDPSTAESSSNGNGNSESTATSSSTSTPTSSSSSGDTTSSSTSTSTTSTSTQSTSTTTSSSTTSSSSSTTTSSTTSTTSSTSSSTTPTSTTPVSSLSSASLSLSSPSSTYPLSSSPTQSASSSDSRAVLTSTPPTTTPVQSSTISFTSTLGSTTTQIVSPESTQGGQLNGGDSSNEKGFFDNSGAVGGTFAAVGIVAALILAGLAWLFYRRRRAQRMDADVAMAASAAAATTRTPFDDDDPEMIEHNYGQGPSGSASNFYHASQGEYEPSQFSGAGYGAAAAGMGAAGAGAYGAAAYHDYYNNGGMGGESQGHYYDNPQQQGQGAYMPAGGGQSQGHEQVYSQGHYYDEYGQPQNAYQNGGYDASAWNGQSPQMNPEGMPFATTGAMAAGTMAGSEQDFRRSAGMPNPHSGAEEDLLGPNVFADQPSPDDAAGASPQHASDDRLNNDGLQRSGSRASAHSLRDDQDYTRRVLSLANS